MTIDECITKYLSGHRVVLTEQNIRDILDMLLSGETVTNTARKLNLKSFNVATVRNVFEFECGLVFPNAKRLRDKKYNSKIKGVDLKTNDDVVKLIVLNEAVNSKTIKEYIRETLNISKKKTDKLFRESMEIYCKCCLKDIKKSLAE